MASGPGLVLPPARRGEGLIRAGAWLDADKLVVAARGVEGDAPFLVGAIYDVRRGSLLREGSVRTVAGTVPSANIGALAAFLLTGAQQREVRARTSEAIVEAEPPASLARLASAPAAPLAVTVPERGSVPPAAPEPLDLRPEPPAAVIPGLSPAGPVASGSGSLAPARRRPWPGARRWVRPAAWVAGGFALGFAGLAVDRRLAANEAYDEAQELLGPGGALVSSTERSRFDSLTADGDAAARNSWISAGASVVFAAAAGFLGWTSSHPAAPGVSF
jgi:hypothetical protein